MATLSLDKGLTIRDATGRKLVVDGSAPVLCERIPGPHAYWADRRLTGMFNMSGSSHWVDGDSSGHTYRLVLDGAISPHRARNDGGELRLGTGLNLAD